MPIEPSLKWNRTIGSFRFGQAAAQWRQGIIAAFAGLFISIALIFAWRRLSGALVNPLSAVLLIPSGLLAGMWVWGIRTLWRGSFARQGSSQGEMLLDIFLGASLLIFAAALTLPGANAWATAFFWLFLGAEEIWAWRARAARLITRLRGKKGSFRSHRIDPAQPILPHVGPAKTESAAVADFLTSPHQPAKEVTQQLVRSMAVDGSEVVSGWLRLDFAPGQRMGNIHVAFCPPFAQTPELTVSQLDGPQSRIKIAQLLPYGIRLDLKLITFIDEPASVLLQFTARATSHQSAALL